jgi:hypothetical protein
MPVEAARARFAGRCHGRHDQHLHAGQRGHDLAGRQPPLRRHDAEQMRVARRRGAIEQLLKGG